MVPFLNRFKFIHCRAPSPRRMNLRMYILHRDTKVRNLRTNVHDTMQPVIITFPIWLHVIHIHINAPGIRVPR